MDSEKLVLYPDVPSYLEYVHNRQAVHFRSLDKPEVDDFILAMSMLDTYDDVVKSVARQLGLVDPSKIRLTPHNCSSEHPKPQLLKYLAVEHLSDMLVHYNQASDILYYEVLDIPLPDVNGSSTGHLERHTDHCLQKLHMSTEKKQPAILSQPSNSANPFVSPGVRYSNENMREIIATAIMVHEQPFSIVEDEVWMWAFQYANSEFQKVTCETVRGDCLAIYEAEKKKLKALLKSVSKISLTIDVWKSSDQVDEYMVIFGHFIDAEWKLQKRILSFAKILAPRQIIDVVGSIFKCLKVWGIENKVFLAVVDNAPYNDSCLRNVIGNLPFGRNLFLGGDLLHIRCFVQILNLLVQDGLSKINDIIYNVRESVRYISYSDLRLKAFYDVVEQKHLKDRKLIIDCPTRCDSTFHMLSIALKFKIAFLAYMEIEPHYDFAPTHEDWEKVEKVCQLLKEFYLATHIISDNEYPTASLYLVEVCRVKQVIDYAAEDKDLFMREMVSPMKVKFDKYLRECNMLIALASVLDPRCKFHIVDICFPLIYKPEEVAKDNIKNVRTSLQELYQEYVSLNIEESSSGEVNIGVNNTPSSSGPKPSVITGFDQIMSLLREKKVVPTMKSELDVYLEEGIYVPNDDNIPFSALEWWRNNSLKFKILSKLAADILAIPFSIVPSESTFSARGRVINEFHSKLNEESIEALICGGDWLRHKYGLKRKLKVPEQQEEITLNI